MEQKKIQLCLLLPTVHSENFTSTAAETDIYGEYMPLLGHEIDWITPCFEKNEAHSNSFRKITVNPVYYPYFFSFFLFRIYGFIIFYFNKYNLVNEMFKKKEYDIIQVRDSVSDSLLALYIKKKYKIPFIFQYTFPTGAYKIRGYKNPFKIIINILGEFCLNYILKKADFIFPISGLMKDDLVSQGLNPNKMMPVPMGVNPDIFRPKNSDKIRFDYKLDDSKVFLYVGSLDKSRNLDVMISAFSIVNKRYENVKLLIVGEGCDKHKLEELALILKLDKKVIFTGAINYFDVPNFISAADICLCPIPPLEIFKVSSPTKLFEYMAINKPIVANKEIPELKNVLDESRAGILVKFQSNSFAEGMIELLDHPLEAYQMGHRGRVWIVKNRSYELMALEIEKIYFKLLSKIE